MKRDFRRHVNLPHAHWWNRRDFLRRTAGAAAGITAASLWAPLSSPLVQLGPTWEPAPAIEDPRLRMLVQRGLDASHTAGAEYADVRLTHTYTRNILSIGVNDIESMAVGVRALVNGYWGFASGPVWSIDEMARLGREAVQLAKINALGKPRPMTLAPIPVVSDGHWTTPIRIDPFSIHPFEVRDILNGHAIYAGRRPGISASGSARFLKQAKAFGSSEGSYYTQQQYMTSGGFSVRYRRSDELDDERSIAGLEPAGVGFELFDDAMIRHNIDATIEAIEADWATPLRPIDVGRYDVVFDANSTAALLDGTIGTATDLDRALGYEANAAGTSYLDDPSAMLGVLELGSSLFGATMNRDEPGGLATVRWDDDGVGPAPVTLVKSGVLVGFQTTREGAGWLNTQFSQRGIAPQSGGCSYAPSAMEAPMAHTGNLVMQHSPESTTLDDLMRSVQKGILFTGLGVGFDFQGRSGIGAGQAYELRNGRKIARLSGAGIMFQSMTLWKALTAIGGAASARRSAGADSKGQPAQASTHSVTAVPVTMKQQAVIDVRRKA